jgi:hypothetical protein
MTTVLRELAAWPIVGPTLKYPWLNEKIWLRKMAKPNEEKNVAPPAQTKSADDFDLLEQELIDDESEADDDKDVEVPEAQDSSDDNQSPRLRSDCNIGCPLMLYLDILPLFNSVQKLIYDIVGNIVTISINQALESIYPVDKDRFDHFDWETCQNSIHYFT